MPAKCSIIEYTTSDLQLALVTGNQDGEKSKKEDSPNMPHICMHTAIFLDSCPFLTKKIVISNVLR
jgi:hypothetical protein